MTPPTYLPALMRDGFARRVLLALSDAPRDGLRLTEVLARAHPPVEPEPVPHTAFQPGGQPWEVVSGQLSVLCADGFVDRRVNGPWPSAGGWVGYRLTDAGRAEVAGDG